MERECLLSLLIVLLGGAALQTSASWLPASAKTVSAGHRERASWARLWWPLMPALVVAAWLCGWALCEPDPVPQRIGLVVFAACVPFAFLVVRAIVRAVWSLLREPRDHGVATIGLIQPKIVFSPELLSLLDDRAIRAALEHERAHMRHRDPLRIWLGQFVTDLQWPWPVAQRRFQVWLAALERARDDEARSVGVVGADLAAAVLVSLRYHHGVTAGAYARLTGEREALEERIACLLQPLPEAWQERRSSLKRVALFLIPILSLAVALGAMFGERILKPLLAIAS